MEDHSIGTSAIALAIRDIRARMEGWRNNRFEAAGDVHSDFNIGSPEVVRADLLGWTKGTDEGKIWFIQPEAWRTKLCEGHDAYLTAKALIDQGILARQDEKHLTCAVKIPALGNNKATRVYGPVGTDE